MEIFRPTRETITYKRNLMFASSIVLATKFLGVTITGVPYLTSLAEVAPWKIKVLLGSAIIYFLYIYTSTLWRDRQGWLRREGMRGGKELELIARGRLLVGVEFSKENMTESRWIDRVKKSFPTNPDFSTKQAELMEIRQEISILPNEIENTDRIRRRSTRFTDEWLPIAAATAAIISLFF